MGKKILLAEDEAHIAKLVVYKLTKEGFEVQVAENGQEAIDQFSEQQWDLVILDVMMPVCDGWQVLKVIRSSEKLSEVPVLILTAKTDHRDVDQAVKLGATQFLRKPFVPETLSEMVKKMIGKPS